MDIEEVVAVGLAPREHTSSGESKVITASSTLCYTAPPTHRTHLLTYWFAYTPYLLAYLHAWCPLMCTTTVLIVRGFHSCVVSLQVKHRSCILSHPQCSAVIAKGDMCTHIPST